MEDVDDTEDASEDGGDAAAAPRPTWTKGVADPNAGAVNVWSLNGFGQPVFTGGLYQPDEARTLAATVRQYCAAQGVTASQLCGGDDHTVHDQRVRGAWQEIARCLPHRTVLSVYRRARRQLHGLTRGTWSKEEVASLFRLVERHGQKWKAIEDRLGRSAVDCRVKFFDWDAAFERGKWSTENIQLLLQEVRAALRVPRQDMDVREINQWTLDHDSKIPWTATSYRVGRRRVDCYFKWKQLTKRSNHKAGKLGLEPVPMCRDTLKVDGRTEYARWKAEQDPAQRSKYAEACLRPLRQRTREGADARREHAALLASLVGSRATRPSEVSWHTCAGGGAASRALWDCLVDKHAADGDLDLPLWTLARLVKVAVEQDATYDDETQETQETAEVPHSGNRAGQEKRPTPRSAPHISGAMPKTNEHQWKADGGDADHKKSKTQPRAQRQAGVPTERLRKAIRDIVEQAHPDATVRSIRELVEQELALDLSPHKHLVKEMIREAL